MTLQLNWALEQGTPNLQACLFTEPAVGFTILCNGLAGSIEQRSTQLLDSPNPIPGQREEG